MLIEFSLSNHRSFAEEQTLTLLASNLKDNHEQRVAIVGGHLPLKLLTTAVLFGKNGSGKSAIVDAMRFVRSFVRSSSLERQAGERIDHRPFRLRKSNAHKDTNFRIVFSVQNNIYQFMFAFNSKRVSAESLYIADKSPRFRKVYDREFDPETDSFVYSFGEVLRGDKNTWQTATRENALFISTAVQLNAEFLKEPFNWITSYLRVIDASSNHHTLVTVDQCADDESRMRIVSFLQRLDINVDDIIVEEEEFDESFLEKTFKPDFIKNVMSGPNMRRKKIAFAHKDDDLDTIHFPIADESTGTRMLFGLAGPIFDALINGYCLIVDEINTNLHPLVVHALIDAFSDPNLNKKRAQLIFTSHDTSLLRDSYFRRDQVWFVDIDRLGQSSISPLTEYSPRKGEALERGYLGGRYGGVPFISPDLSIPTGVEDDTDAA